MDNIDFSLYNRSSLDYLENPNIGGVQLHLDVAVLKDVIFSGEDGSDTLQEVIDSVRLVYEHLPAPFAFSQLPLKHEYETTVTREHLETPELPDVYWLMMLSPEICEDIGRERLKSAPVWRSEPLPDGGMELVATDDLQFTREHKQRLRDHLGFTD
ncbi:hypothetical protein HARCEL1_00750 [Halococcoides cellulosivorans]|uniref:Uncharacterized protein n=2 Tax=Halococcoides cellulosivorans TaxID=1679096 RepID=A0A2R4WXW1_9EURY|nr:hypothetical protein HARCEL1_00750 [Halococcoides cellulosivorans]